MGSRPFVDLKERRRQPELMDDPSLDEERHAEALRALARINRLSRTAEHIWSGLRRTIVELPRRERDEPLRVLDLACGGGDVALALDRMARRRGVAFRVDGCDVNRVALEQARHRAQRKDRDASFFRVDVVAEPLPGGYDVLCCTLFLHHLEDPEAVKLIEKMATAAGRAVIIQDLVRSRLGYLLAWLGTRLLTRSEVARTDGPRSVRSAFTADEVAALARRAGLRDVCIRRCWPQRFCLTWSVS